MIDEEQKERRCRHLSALNTMDVRGPERAPVSGQVEAPEVAVAVRLQAERAGMY
jgi:hypothetical protein